MCSCSLHSLCAGCITPGGGQLKSGFSDLKYLFVASHSFLCSPPAPCHDPRSHTEPCTGASNSYSVQLQGSARDQVLGCDLIQGIFSRKIQFPAGIHTTLPHGQLPTEEAAPALHNFSSQQPHLSPTKAHCKFFTPLGAKSSMSAVVQQRLKGPSGSVIYVGEGVERMCLTGRMAAPMQGKTLWEAKAGVSVLASDQDSRGSASFPLRQNLFSLSC